MNEQVDILEPPFFQPSGRTKPRGQAHADGDWIGTFNLWIVTRHPKPAIVYQQRSLTKSWAPGLLDVAAGGHYLAGETLADGLREVREELGKDYKPADIRHLGKRMYVGPGTNGRTRNNIVDVYITEDNSPLTSYVLQPEEVTGILHLPIDELLKVHKDRSHSFQATILDTQGKPAKLTITKDSFPHNWDDYHYKMAILAKRYRNNEANLIY
jgi:isopentenyldiphosphate isomerase